MKKQLYSILLIAVAVVAVAFTVQDPSEPWTKEQLMEPADLARILNDVTSPQPIILNIGSVGDIQGAESIGIAKNEDGLENLRTRLSSLPKDADIVIYCGCCPFKDCPNVRPAFSLLTEMNFTDPKLLDLPDNLKVDWIDKGYPMSE